MALPEYFAFADGFDDANYYELLAGHGTRGTNLSGNLHMGGWFWLETTAVSQIRYMWSSEQAGGAAMGATIYTNGTHTQLFFRARGSVIVEASIPLDATYYDRPIYIHGVIDGTNGVVQLFVDGVLVKSVSFSNTYTLPTGGMLIGRRPGTAGTSVLTNVRVSGVCSGNSVPTKDEISLAYAKGLLASHDVVAIPGKTDHLWSFAQDGACNSTWLDRIGTDHMGRHGAPVYTAGDAYVATPREPVDGHLTPFGLNSHWHDLGLYDEWQDAGVEWLRIGVYWYQVEPTQGNFDFLLIDKAFADLQKRGLRVLCNLGYGTVWASSTPTPGGFTTPGDDNKFAPKEIYDSNWQAYITKIVDRYGPVVHAWEVWNEPDGHVLFQNGPGSWASNHYPAETAINQRRIEIKHLVDLAMDSSTGLAAKYNTTSGFADGGPSWDSGLRSYLGTQSGYLAQHEAFQQHVYGYPSYSLLTSLATQSNAINAAAVPTSQAGKPIWYGEHGLVYSTTPPSDTLIKQWTIRSYAIGLTQANVTKLFWFCGVGFTGTSNFLDSASKAKLASYFGYQTMTGHLAGLVSIAAYSSGTAAGCVATFANGDKCYVLWDDSGAPRTLSSLFLQATLAWNINDSPIALSAALSPAPIFAFVPLPAIVIPPPVVTTPIRSAPCGLELHRRTGRRRR